MDKYESFIGKPIEQMTLDEFNRFWELKYGDKEKKKGCQVEAEVGIANGGQIPETITFETKDIIELLSFIDMSLQPDFPVNKARGLLSKLKKICLKYGINWTGRQFQPFVNPTPD